MHIKFFATDFPVYVHTLMAAGLGTWSVYYTSGMLRQRVFGETRNCVSCYFSTFRPMDPCYNRETYGTPLYSIHLCVFVNIYIVEAVK